MKGGRIISLALIILCGLLFMSTFKEKNQRNELPPIWIKGNIVTKEENNFTIIVTDNDYCDFISKSEKIVIDLSHTYDDNLNTLDQEEQYKYIEGLTEGQEIKFTLNDETLFDSNVYRVKHLSNIILN